MRQSELAWRPTPDHYWVSICLFLCMLVAVNQRDCRWRSHLDMFHVSLRDVFLIKGRCVGEMTGLPFSDWPARWLFSYTSSGSLYSCLRCCCMYIVGCQSVVQQVNTRESMKKMAEQLFTSQKPKLYTFLPNLPQIFNPLFKTSCENSFSCVWSIQAARQSQLVESTIVMGCRGWRSLRPLRHPKGNMSNCLFRRQLSGKQKQKNK